MFFNYAVWSIRSCFSLYSRRSVARNGVYPCPSRPYLSQSSIAKSSVKPKPIGQRAIDDQRATQIQTALIHSGYLTGTPSGHWDEQTEAAMTKLQADNGWQTKLVPDSRAIIKLGLGPSTAYNGAADHASVANQANTLATSSIAQ